MKNFFRWPVLWWLRFWARQVLKINRPFIVGVTGSAGKSSAVTAIAPVLKLKFRNLKIAEKANSESGIPADILGLHFGESSSPIVDWIRICLLAPFRALHSVFGIPCPQRLRRRRCRREYSAFDCYLVEMGIDEPTPPKNMGYLLTILKPDIAVILNALPVHTQQFERPGLASQGRALIKSIATEKGKLVTQNSNLKYAILNADQPEINSLLISSGLPRRYAPRNDDCSGVKTLTFGKGPEADIRILSIKPSLAGTEILLQYNKQKYFIKLNRLALPEFYGYTIASAFATGICLGQDPQTIADKISAGFSLPPGRGRIFEGVKNTTIIDSSYNASGETMIGSLKMLQKIGKNKIKIAVLGDMRELGSQAETEHQKVVESAVKIADKIILVGPLMNQYALPLIKQTKIPINWFPTAGEATNYLTENISGKELILVKGSQNTIFLEIVVEALLKNKSDVENLCRRGSFWDKKRKPFKL